MFFLFLVENVVQSRSNCPFSKFTLDLIVNNHLCIIFSIFFFFFFYLIKPCLIKMSYLDLLVKMEGLSGGVC